MRPRSYLAVVATGLLSHAGLLAASEAPQPDQYETPGSVSAADFLPKSAFSGKEVFVEKIAQNDGLQNTYRITAGTEEYEITGCAGAMELVQELKAINELRQIILQSANQALTPADGRYFEQVAELLAAYSQKMAPLQSFRLQDGLLCATDNKGMLIVPISLDYVIWTAKVAQRVDGLAHVPVDESTIKGVQVCTDGKASERVKSELSKRGIGYQSLFGVME